LYFFIWLSCNCGRWSILFKKNWVNNLRICFCICITFLILHMICVCMLACYIFLCMYVTNPNLLGETFLFCKANKTFFCAL